MNEQNILPYRDKHKGQKAILFCTGPSLEKYDYRPLLTAETTRPIMVGVNGIIFAEVAREVGLDYLFLQDTGRVNGAKHKHVFHQNIDEFAKFKCREQKFYGTFIHGDLIAPTKKEAQHSGAKQYEMIRPKCLARFPLVDDIGHFTLGGGCSVAFSALQFILFTGVSKVQVVGCDGTSNGYAGIESGEGIAYDRILSMWKMIPSFLQEYYPDIKLEIVRPVALRGIGLNTSSE
ncbi:hypothetical protein N9M16_01820 [Candidatus Dependentiae bacterium]|nr:hypothetical protein [Candidatus Dependentiae bacterium]